MQKPEVKPNHPFFSSGPCSKRPGWNLEALNNAFLGRSHRAKNGKAKFCLLYTSPSPRDRQKSRMPSSA